MVLRETQRAFVYFSLHGLTVDTVIVNRVLPADVMDAWFSEWHTSQDKVLREIEEYFAPVPVKRVPLFAREVLGKQRLEELARSALSGQRRPFSRHAHREALSLRQKQNGVYEIRVLLPFATKGEIGLFKKGDELVVEVGTLRRHIGLPRSMAALQPATRQARKSRPHRRNEGGTMSKQRANHQTEHESNQRASRSCRRTLHLPRSLRSCTNASASRPR